MDGEFLELVESILESHNHYCGPDCPSMDNDAQKARFVAAKAVMRVVQGMSNKAEIIGWLQRQIDENNPDL